MCRRGEKAVISKQESFSATLSRSYIVFTLTFYDKARSHAVGSLLSKEPLISVAIKIQKKIVSKKEIALISQRAPIS